MSSATGRVRPERPKRRVNPDGKTVVWIARYTRPDGQRAIWKPTWNRGKGTFARQDDAQRAINEAYDWHENHHGSHAPLTLGDYFATWTQHHPRAERTNITNENRIAHMLDVKLEGKPLRDWPYGELRRRHANGLVDHMLRQEGRAVTGVRNILRSLSAMNEDAITDETAEINFVQGVKVRANDPRCTKPAKAKRIFTFEQMHAFAAKAGAYEPMIRAFSDTGMRLGEVLPLRRTDFDGKTFSVSRTAHEGAVEDGTKTDHGEPVAGREVPCPPALAELIRAMPARIDTDLLFPTHTGKLWRERNFYRDVWEPTREASGMACTPHEFRHSYISHLRAMGVDDADLAKIAGHTIETMIGVYTHSTGKSFDKVRGLIG